MSMHVISRKAIREFCAAHPQSVGAEDALNDWFRVVSHAEWRNFGDVRETYASADKVGDLVVFNVGGNKYRILAEVIYDDGQLVLVRGIFTHPEYDKLKLK
jgi:mRNA interferase HigB